MASSGIRRKVDDLGRVVIPAGIRRQLNIREGDTVEVTVEGERVVLARPLDICVFCGHEGGELERFRGRLVCGDCVRSISEVYGGLPAGEDAPADARPAESTHPRPQGDDTGHDLTTPLRLRSGPIDGDALARQEAARHAQEPPADDDPRRPHPPADEDRGGPEPPGDRGRPAPRPHYEPASTTSW